MIHYRVYFAAPLFTQSEWQWNERLAEGLRQSGYDVTLPQDRAKPMMFGAETFDPGLLFEQNVAGISSFDFVLAVLDQADADSGTCWECGYAYKSGKPIIGLRTDIRPAGDDTARPVNLMLARCCREFIVLPFDQRDNMAWIVCQIGEAAQRSASAPELETLIR